jgi:hypothetical protein
MTTTTTPQFGFKIAVGWDQFDPPNIETIITDAPTVLYDQRITVRGGIRKQAIDGTIHRNGWRNHIWRWSYMSQEDFNTLIATIWEDADSQPVTIWSIDETGTYIPVNATAERPYVGEHYQMWAGGAIRDLEIHFWNLQTVYFSFDDSFDDSFG